MCIVYDKLLKPRQSFQITLYIEHSYIGFRNGSECQVSKFEWLRPSYTAVRIISTHRI